MAENIPSKQNHTRDEWSAAHGRWVRAEWADAEIERLTERLANQIDENDRLRGVNTFWGGKTEAEREIDRLRAVVAVATEECSRQGCHCPGEIKGECSFCRIGAAIAQLHEPGG